MSLVQRFFNLTFTAKVTITVLVTSLLSSAVVVGVTYYLMTQRFDTTNHLDAMRESLIAGVIIATVLALVIGIVIGARLHHRVERLTQAVRAMEHGQLRQHVPVDTQDEIGELAGEFNRMSDAVATHYQDLQDSREHMRQQAAQLRELSAHDALTNLYNRRYFDEQGAILFARAERYQRPLTVMMADIDHFKKVNDTFSHAMGDEVLRHIGALLTAKLRNSDMVARYGGEEFVVAFPETTLPQAIATCELLRQHIESYPWHTLHPDLKITMSMGLCGDVADKDIHAMVQTADEQLYKAKQTGRNRVCASGNAQ